MVWLADRDGRTRLAPCLVALYAELDRRYPNRSKVSDGTIGDRAHAARKSDHNPEDDRADADKTLWVTAADVTSGSPGGPNVDAWFDDLRRNRDARIDYLIRRSRITGPRFGWNWAPYTGSNPHDKHGHISVHNTAAARNDLRPWFPTAATPPEEDVLTPTQANQLSAAYQLAKDNADRLVQLEAWMEPVYAAVLSGGNASAQVDAQALADKLRDSLGEAVARELAELLARGAA